MCAAAVIPTRQHTAITGEAFLKTVKHKSHLIAIESKCLGGRNQASILKQNNTKLWCKEAWELS